MHVDLSQKSRQIKRGDEKTPVHKCPLHSTFVATFFHSFFATSRHENVSPERTFISLKFLKINRNSLVRSLADIDFSRHPSSFGPRCEIYSVAKQTVAWHSMAYDSRHNFSRMDANSNLLCIVKMTKLTRKLKKLISSEITLGNSRLDDFPF